MELSFIQKKKKIKKSQFEAECMEDSFVSIGIGTRVSRCNIFLIMIIMIFVTKK